MTDEERRLYQALKDVAEVAQVNADAGAPAGMVAVYVELFVRHAIGDHPGEWHQCTECHVALAASGWKQRP